LLDVVVNLGVFANENLVDRLYDYHFHTGLPFTSRVRDSILFAAFALDAIRKLRTVTG
jgi:hypothetical protein